MANSQRHAHEGIADSHTLPPSQNPSVKKIVIAGFAIFLVASGVRLLLWQDSRFDAPRVQSGVVHDYRQVAQIMREDGPRSFFVRSARLSDPNLLGHPPGYPALLAILFSVFGDSNKTIQFFNLAIDALAAVVIFLLAIELVPFKSGVIAGFLAALAPQFAWNSVLLLPDTLAVFPILIAIYCLVRAYKKPRVVWVLLAGICIGVSCWLRANSLLMAPFLLVMFPVVFRPGRRLVMAAALLGGWLIILAPLTIRNWIVYDHFIPVSLGAGQTMLEGIADYDPGRRFGIPDTDMAIMKMEAEEFNRPEYYTTLFAPDGILRERMRLARGFRVVRENPIWFAGVMVRRAGSMLRLERARLVSSAPPFKHDFNVDNISPIWTGRAAELLSQAELKHQEAQFSIAPDGETLRIDTNKNKSDVQLVTTRINVKPKQDYLFTFPVLLERGRMAVAVVNAQTNRSIGDTIIDFLEVKEGQPQPRQVVSLPFASTDGEPVKLSFENGSATTRGSVINIGAVQLFELGPATYLWTKYPRVVIRSVQKLFITAVMLPLTLLGLVLLVRRRAWPILALLFCVPFYYFCFQSMLHTEYRYVLAIHYFLFVLTAVAVHEIVSAAWRLMPTRDVER